MASATIHRAMTGAAPRRAVRTILAAVVATSLVGCAAPKPDVVWAAPDIAANNGLMRGTNVLVACEAPDVALRNVCQDQLAQQATAHGARPFFVPDGTPLTNARPLDEQLVASARSVNASAVLVLSIRPVATESESPFSLSIGGFGFGGRSAVGGGITAPIGDPRVSTGFAANGRVTSVATGRLVWTASASAPPTDDLPRQFASLSASVLDSASKAGLF